MSTPTDRDMERAHAALHGAGSFEQRIGQLIADERAGALERAASVCDDVGSSDSRTPMERSIARMLAERIRSGRL